MMEIKDMDEYQLLAKRTQPQLSKRDLLLNMTIGICGEGGELADTVKKEIYHGHEVDDLAKAKELGDILWYVANAADVLGYSLQEIAEMNIEKLRKRFPNGFSTVDSIKRVDTL